MEGFDKIRNLNLAELGDNPEDSEEELMEEVLDDQALENLPQEMEDGEVIIEDAEEEDIPQVKKTIADPVGEHYYVDADITEGVLRSFMMGHAYRQPITLILMVACVLYPIVSFVKHKPIVFPLCLAVAIVIYYPFTMYMRAKKVKNTNPTFSETFHYMFDEVGCHLQLTNQAVDVDWKYFKKVLELKSVAVIYTTNNNGYILPMEALGARKGEILAFIRKHING